MVRRHSNDVTTESKTKKEPALRSHGGRAFHRWGKLAPEPRAGRSLSGSRAEECQCGLAGVQSARRKGAGDDAAEVGVG